MTALSAFKSITLGWQKTARLCSAQTLNGSSCSPSAHGHNWDSSSFSPPSAPSEGSPLPLHSAEKSLSGTPQLTALLLPEKLKYSPDCILKLPLLNLIWFSCTCSISIKNSQANCSTHDIYTNHTNKSNPTFSTRRHQTDSPMWKIHMGTDVCSLSSTSLSLRSTQLLLTSREQACLESMEHYTDSWVLAKFDTVF